MLPSPQEFRTLWGLAVPVVVVQLGLMLMGVVDTLMVGRLSAQALAAVAIGNLYFFTAVVVGMGILMSLDPVVSQAAGAQDEAGISRGLQRGIVLALVISIPAMALLAVVEPALRLIGQPPELIPDASRYIYYIIPGIVPFYLFIAMRQTLQALGHIGPIVRVIIGANLLNAALNWVFIYGKLGLPAMGVAGSALATTIGRLALAVGLLYLGRVVLMPRLRPWRPEATDLPALGRMLRIGLPIGAQMFAEYGVFAFVGAVMGRIGTLAVGGHQIALNLSSIVFMVPQGVGAAAAVLVGQAIGAGDQPRARRAALGALLLGGGFMVASALLFLTFPGRLARFYSLDDGVVGIAASLIVLGGIFAVFDGLQAVAVGILRGIGDTRVPVILSLVGYWIIGVPVSLWLGLEAGLGPDGLWWGLVLGLGVTAVVLMFRVRDRLGRRIARVMVDPEAG